MRMVIHGRRDTVQIPVAHDLLRVPQTGPWPCSRPGTPPFLWDAEPRGTFGAVLDVPDSANRYRESQDARRRGSTAGLAPHFHTVVGPVVVRFVVEQEIRGSGAAVGARIVVT